MDLDAASLLDILSVCGPKEVDVHGLHRTSPAVVAGLALLGLGGGTAQGVLSAEKPLDVSVDWEWVTLPASPGSAVRACVSGSGHAYDDTLHSCRPIDLRREFRLPKTDYLLGEPIVVQFLVALEGPGRWQEWVGGNYRQFGRDGNFFFLMRSADGSWVPDPYEPYPRVHIGGGLGYGYVVTRETRFSCWLAIQRWSALERPGTYDLFAMRFAREEPIGCWQAIQAAIENRYGAHWVVEPDSRQFLGTWNLGYRQVCNTRSNAHRRVAIEFRDVSPGSPPIGTMPVDLRDKLGTRAGRVTDFAHFRIVVQSPTPEEGAAMVARIAQFAETSTRASPASQADATREAIWFVRQDYFLPTVAGWMRKDSRSNHYTGLAMNPTASAQSLLFDELCRGAVDADWYLPSRCTSNAIPVLISRLGDPEPRVRGIADRYLRIWTGLWFGPAGAWRPNPQEDPTREQGRRMQAAWARWWKGNASTFRPTDPWERPLHRTDPGGPLPNPAGRR